MKNYKTPRWNDFPDLALYMDQVITYLESHLPKQGDETLLTPAMVNNYVKQGIIERPTKKKYEKEQLSQLFALSLLKQVYPISDVGELLKELGDSPEDRYSVFQSMLDQKFESIDTSNDSSVQALNYLLDAYISVFKAKQILNKQSE